MANYKTAEAITARNEGGFANDKDDYGGMTINGISYVNWSAWIGWARVKAIIARVGWNESKINAEVRKDTVLLQLISDFYKVNFWDVNKLDLFKSQALANEMFDTGVNMGTGVAARFLQEALNLCNKNQKLYPNISVDGVIGNGTLTALSKAPQDAVLNTLNLLQGEKYLKLMRANEVQEKFWRSWLSRVFISGKW